VIVDVRMPNMGEERGEEATVSFWFFDEGDSVERGEGLVEIITDETTFNVPAPVSGKLVEIVVGEADTLTVGDVLCRIEVASQPDGSSS